jgi:hypothetical protein
MHLSRLNDQFLAARASGALNGGFLLLQVLFLRGELSLAGALLCDIDVLGVFFAAVFMQEADSYEDKEAHTHHTGEQVHYPGLRGILLAFKR